MSIIKMGDWDDELGINNLNIKHQSNYMWLKIKVNKKTKYIVSETKNLQVHAIYELYSLQDDAILYN